MTTLHKDPKPIIGEGAESIEEMQEPDTSLNCGQDSA